MPDTSPSTFDDGAHASPQAIALPEAWSAALAKALEPGEQVRGVLELDLDRTLHYRPGLVAATNRRVLAAEGDPDERVTWESFFYTDIASARAHGGNAGQLELFGKERRLSTWRFTAGRYRAAQAMVDVVQAAVQAKDGALVNGGATVCPTCGERLPPGANTCPACAPMALAPPSRSLFRLLRFARPRAGMILLGLALTVGGTAASMIPPYLTIPLLDDVLVPHQNGRPIDFQLVGYYLGALFAASVAAWLLSWARTWVLAWVSERISADLRDVTYSHLQQLSLEFFGSKRTGDLISRVGSDTDRICNFLSLTVLDFITDILMIAMTAGILLWIDPVLALCTLLPMPLVAWMVQRSRNGLRQGFARSYRAWGAMVSVLADTIPGIRVVKAFAQEQREIDRFRRGNEAVLSANDSVNRLWSMFGPMVTFLMECGLLIVWGFGIWRVAQNHITVGVLTAFLAYISRFYTRLESMSRMIASTQRAAAASHRIFEILDRKPSVPDPVHPVLPGRLKGKIELRNVHFKYGTRPVIKGMDLTVQPGELIGLVGPSGAGKSTLVNLVCRFFDVAEGAILVDDTDIRAYPVAEYRRNIGIVLQEPFLFYGTISENISYGRADATREEIIAAARAARAHEFILRLPDGYDSLVGERGQSLSGGERQRISIARAILTDPRILILDEATSSVDTETEQAIQEALENLIRGRTTIAIAHRLSTLRKADRLVVISDGKIVEMGRHYDLVERSGLYARLHEAQVQMSQPAAI